MGDGASVRAEMSEHLIVVRLLWPYRHLGGHIRFMIRTELYLERQARMIVAVRLGNELRRLILVARGHGANGERRERAG